MIPTFARQTITRLRPGTTTSRGSTIRDWTTATALQIAGCSVQPTATSMSMDGRVEATAETLTAYLPEGSDIKEGDRVIFDGDTYEIDGKPKKWTGAVNLSHIQIVLKRWEG